jgi:predicted MFS family arabinose efflux permease
MLAMVSLGLGEIVGSITMGLIVDKIGPKKACLVNVFLIFFQTLVVLIYII